MSACRPGRDRDIRHVPADNLRRRSARRSNMCSIAGEGVALRGPARSGALPHRAAHRRHAGAVGARAAHAGAAAVSREAESAGEPSAGDYALNRGPPRKSPRRICPICRRCRSDRRLPIALVGAGGISAAHLDAYARHGLNVVVDLPRAISRKPRRGATRSSPKPRATDDFEVAARATRHPGARHHDPSRTYAPADAARPRRGQACPIAEAVRRRPRGRRRRSSSWRKRKGSGSRSTRTAAGRRISPICVRPSRGRPRRRGDPATMSRSAGTTAGSPAPPSRRSTISSCGTSASTGSIFWRASSATAPASCTRRRRGPRADGAAAAPRRGARRLRRRPGLAHLRWRDAFGARDATAVIGTKGVASSVGPDLGAQAVELHTEAGVARPALKVNGSTTASPERWANSCPLSKTTASR